MIPKTPTRSTPARQKGEAWQWREGRVNKEVDYFELRYGEPFSEWILVAVAGRVRKGLVSVQFLFDRTDPRNSKIVDDLVRELDFYLAELREQDPWRYLQYHCGTASNVYSAVHWSFMWEATSNESLLPNRQWLSLMRISLDQPGTDR